MTENKNEPIKENKKKKKNDGKPSVPAQEPGSEQVRDYTKLYIGDKPLQAYLTAISRTLPQQAELTMYATPNRATTFMQLIESISSFTGILPIVRVVRDDLTKKIMLIAKLKEKVD